jgi:hypothetical protein
MYYGQTLQPKGDRELLKLIPFGRYYVVPWPYQMKIDAGWVTVTALVLFGFLFSKLFWMAAGLITFMRIWIWLTFKFPLTMTFFLGVLVSLIGGGRRR